MTGERLHWQRGAKAASKWAAPWRNTHLHATTFRWYVTILFIGSWVLDYALYFHFQSWGNIVLKIHSIWISWKEKLGSKFLLRCDLSTIFLFSKQSFFEQKEICGRWENPHNFYVVESAKGQRSWLFFRQPDTLAGCPEIHCYERQQN